MSEQEQKISKETWLSFSLVLTMIGAAVTFGAMYQKVETLTENVADISKTLTETRDQQIEDRAFKKQILDAVSDIKSDINDIKKTKR